MISKPVKPAFSILKSAVLITCLASSSAYAVLGGPVTHQIGTITQGGGGSTVYQSFVFGKSITEYAVGGKVFAVKWSGPSQPDLMALYGSYFNDYANAQRASGMFGMGHVETNTGAVVIWHSGHIGAMHGFAYIPALLPKGFDISVFSK